MTLRAEAVSSSAYVRLFQTSSRAYAMGMPAQKTEWTAEMVRALPDDGNRYEAIDGELFVSPAPAPKHQAVLARLFLILFPYVTQHRLGWVWWSPADIELSPKTAVQPDLFVVPDEGRGEPQSWSDITRLLLVVEGLSASTASYDRLKKRPAYQKAAIPEYWILDIDSRLVERWTPEDLRPEVIADILEWRPRPEITPLLIKLEDIFGPESK
jgi:Uma2 family endonuclease